MSATKVNYAEDRGQLFYVLADGKFRQSVPEGTEGAVRRDYETSDGNKGTKFELVANSIEGTITNLSLYEGEFGKNVLIVFGDEDPRETVTVSLSLNSNFGEEFLKRLPNINTDVPVKLTPYSFENEQGKRVRGINVEQSGDKLYSAYHEYNAKTKKSKPQNGYPELPAQKEVDGWDSDEWKLYFAQARKFLLGELQKHDLFVEELETEEEDNEEDEQEF